MSKKIIVIVLMIILVIGGIIGIMFFKNKSKEVEKNSNNMSSMAEVESNKVEEKKTAKNTLREGETIQTENKDKATRVITGGTKIKMTFGEKIIYGVLNDSETSKALIEKLKEAPIVQKESRYTHDFCGVTEDLPYNKEEEHYGWLNGDIDYATDAPYFTILFKDEDISEQYGSQVNIGVITSNISEIDSLSGSYDVTIELDD